MITLFVATTLHNASKKDQIWASSSLGEIFTYSLNIPWKDWCWCNVLATWCEEMTHWKRPWCWEILKARGKEFEQTPRDSERQRSLACCSSWECGESDITLQLNNNTRIIEWVLLYSYLVKFRTIFRDVSEWEGNVPFFFFFFHFSFCACFLLLLKEFL